VIAVDRQTPHHDSGEQMAHRGIIGDAALFAAIGLITAIIATGLIG
jgi:hypothetical protein